MNSASKLTRLSHHLSKCILHRGAFITVQNNRLVLMAPERQYILRLFCAPKHYSTGNNSTDTDKVSDNFENDVQLAERIEALAHGIVDGASTSYGQLGSLSKQKVADTIKKLIDSGLPHQVLDSIAECPQVLNKPEQLQALLQAFRDIGVAERKMVTMVENDSDVLTFKKEDLVGAFHKLLELGFTSDTIVEVIVKQPGILKAELKGVGQRIDELKTLFNTKHTFQMFKNNPRLLFCDLEEIRSKFLYVYSQMGIPQPQMMHTQLFNYPLEHIHARHIFVVRAGFFRNVKAKEKFANPKLDTILDTSDAVFAKKFGNMTEEDYLCFKELLLKEQLLNPETMDFEKKEASHNDGDMLDDDMHDSEEK